MKTINEIIITLMVAWRFSESEKVVVVYVLDESKAFLSSHINASLVYHKQLTRNITSNNDVIVKTTIARDNATLDVLEAVCDAFESGAFAIVDMTTPVIAPLLESFAQVLGIPYISVMEESYRRPTTHNDSPYNIPVVPPVSSLLSVISGVVRRESLSNVAILCDDTFELRHIPRRILYGLSVQHIYVRVSSSGDLVEQQLKSLINIEIENFFILTSAAMAGVILGKISNLDITHDMYTYFVISKESKLNCPRCRGKLTVIGISGLLDYTDSMKQPPEPGFSRNIPNIDEAFSFDLMTLIAKALSRTPAVIPLNYSDCYTVDSPAQSSPPHAGIFTRILKNTTQNGVFGALRYLDGRIQQHLTLTVKRHTFEMGESIKEEKIADWREKTGFDIQGRILPANRKKRYRVVLIPQDPPFIYRVENGSEVSYEGYCIDLLERIATRMDFDYTIYECPDDQYGHLADDGTWNGVIRELADKRADIAIGPLSIMAERENVVDFTVPYYDLVGITILMKKPKYKYSIFKFMAVLEEEVWGCIVGAFFVFSVLISVFDRLSPFSYQNNSEKWDGKGVEPRMFTLREGIWFCMMSLTPQGGGEAPRALSGRVIAATWWMFGFIVIATYTANLAAFLTVSRLETPIKSLDDLSKQVDTKFAPLRGSSTQSYFKRMADIEKKFYSIWKSMSLNGSMDAVERARLAVWDYPVSDKYIKIWESMTSSRFPNTTQEAIERVLSEDFAFIGDSTMNKYYTYINCQLWEVGEEFSRKPYAFAVQEGSPLRNGISNVILQLLNQRFLEELKVKWWQDIKVQCPKVEDEADGISIYNIGGVFLVIAIGAVLSLVIFAAEFYTYRLQKPPPSPQKENPLKDFNYDSILTKKGASRFSGGRANAGFDISVKF